MTTLLNALKTTLAGHGITVSKVVAIDSARPFIYVEPLKDGFRLAYSTAIITPTSEAPA